MSTYISYRLFHITIILMAFFIAFTAISFAQEADSAESQTLRQTRPLQLNETAVERVAEKRAEVKERNEARKAEFMEKVEEMTDEAKGQALVRIMEAIETINDNKTTRWAQALDKFSDILERIKTKLDALEEEGVDTASAAAKVTEAESSIADAATAVEAQADKTYEAEITDETTLRQVIQQLVQGFKQDIRTTLSTVVAARDAVKEAARALAAVNSDNQSGSESTINTQNVIEP